MYNNFHTKVFLESLGEYEEYENILKSSWKTWLLRFNKARRDFTQAKVLDKETKLLQTAVKGIDVKVFAFPDHEINAFVIPGYYVGMTDNDEVMDMVEKMWKKYYRNGIYRNLWEILFATQVETVAALKNYKIDQKNRIVNFVPRKPDRPTQISVFATYGLLTFFNPKQRRAIYMHEIGHWVSTAKSIPIHMLEHLDRERIFFLSHEICKRAATRYDELDADRFAKDAGYGKDLADALGQFGKSNVSDFSFIVKYNNKITKLAIESDNYIESLGGKYINQYPSMKTRREYLK